MIVVTALEYHLSSVGATCRRPEPMSLLRSSSIYYSHVYKHFGLLSEKCATRWPRVGRVAAIEFRPAF